MACKGRKDEMEESVSAMGSAAGDEKIRDALSSIGQYLSDVIPPVHVAESVATLLREPAQLMASEIVSWISAQSQGERKASVTDYLLHALIKLHYLGQLQLVHAEALTPYLESVKQLLLERCPPAYRAKLRESFGRIGITETAMATPINLIYMQTKPGQMESENQASLISEQTENRLSGPRSQLKPEMQAPVFPKRNEQREDAIPQLIATASSDTQTSSELGSFQKNLRSLGINPDADQIFRALSCSLPGWMIATTEMAPAKSRNPAVEAMVQIIHLAEDHLEVGKRFQEMVRAAIEQFNTGSLARAATMFDLAVDMSSYHRLDSSVVTYVRQSMHKSLDLNRLRNLAKERNKHRLLRKVLNFFHEFTVDNMLNSLQKEVRRDRRRFLLTLLEAHGDTARKAVFNRLKQQIENTDVASNWYFPRNLICLLMDIPRSRDVSLREEMELVAPLLTLSLPVPLVKEAIRFASQTRCDKSEDLLIATADKLENDVFACSSSDRDPTQKIALLDITICALAHLGTPKGYGKVVKHGISHHNELGDTMARLTYLAGQDLSGDRESIMTLTQFIKNKMPRKLFGVTIQKNEDLLLRTIKALSSTPDVVVRLTLDVVAEHFPETKFGQAAADALKEFRILDKHGDPSERSLAGDLDLFGLPDLLQQLYQSSATGILILKNEKSNPVGEITLLAGRMRHCSVGRLEGMEAAYQLLEKPTGGAYVFKGQTNFRAQVQAEELKLPDIVSIMFEGIRRYDELQRLRAILPDFVQLKPKGSLPAPRGESNDEELVDQIWQKIEAGASPEECEAIGFADSWRVRSLLACWVEDGILTIEQH